MATINRASTVTDIRDNTRQVAKELDIETISADTFLRFMRFLGIETNETSMDQHLKGLSNKSAQRQKQKRKYQA